MKNSITAPATPTLLKITSLHPFEGHPYKVQDLSLIHISALDDLCGTQNLISVDKSEKVPLNAYFIMLIELAKLSCSNLGIEDGYAEQPYSYAVSYTHLDVYKRQAQSG